MIEPGRTNHRGVTAHADAEQLSEGEVLYACPACGEVVSNHDPAAMRLHHLHVINAPQLDRTVEALRDRIEADRAASARHKERLAQSADAPRFALASR